ncbi:hypothetical protein GCM10023205_47620 [Yinghuangia aomiensis]|uniref:Uncharacterized protein n=1 Tax=Yinghuangia aomiensis TaxID=676205 RepID=A0ABP9HNT5_9ACTN
MTDRRPEDMPPMAVDVVEPADSHPPYGVRYLGEPPTVSATPAIPNAIRNATGLDLPHPPAGPEHICGVPTA